MKTALLALCLAVASVVHAAPLSKIWLDVREVANHSARSNSYETTWGSYDYRYAGYKQIRVKLHNSSDEEVYVGVEVAFIARGPAGGLHVASYKRERVELGKKDAELTYRADFSGRDLNLVLVPARDVTGGRPHGWVVQLWMEGKVIARQASLTELENWIEKNPVKVRAPKP